MKKLLIFVFAVFLLSCEQEEFTGTGLESLREFTLVPISGSKIELNSVAPEEEIEITWNEARSGLGSEVTYTWMLDAASGDFSSPIVSVSSDADGTAEMITFTNEELDEILEDEGLSTGEEFSAKWTVSATNGEVTQVAEAATLTIKRFENAIAPFNLVAPANEASVELDIDNPDTQIVIDWDSTFTGFGDDVTYVWVADETGEDFSDPVLTVDSDNSGVDHQLTFTHQQLDTELENLGLEQGASITLDWKVVASGAGLELASEVYTITLRRFNPFVGIETLFLVGDATAPGWDNNNNNTPLYRDPANNFKYYYRGYFNAGSFKLLEQRGQWQPQWGKGSGDGILAVNDGSTSDPGTIDIVTAGYYEFEFDGENMTYTLSTYDASGAADYTTVGIIGSATPNEWNDPDTDMTQSTFDSHIWYISSQPLVEGAMKFRTEDAWDVNWGSNTFPVGQGALDGANIPVEDGGTYDIWFNDLDGRYTLIAQ